MMSKKSIPLEIDPTILEKSMRIIKENPVEEEFNKLIWSDTFPSKFVKPSPGFCLKTYLKSTNKKVFINVCTTDAIPSPRDITNEELKSLVNSEDPSNFTVPMSIGEARTELDKSYVPATVYDVAINPDFYKKVMTDDLFHTFFIAVVTEALENKYQCFLEKNRYVILKHRKTMGTLQTHRIRKTNECDKKTKTPLVEELLDTNKDIKNLTMEPKLNPVCYRVRRIPLIEEIKYYLVEFQIPQTIDVKDLDLKIGEDRLILDVLGILEPVDFFLPEPVDVDSIEAEMNRNNNILSVKVPVKREIN